MRRDRRVESLCFIGQKRPLILGNFTPRAGIVSPASSAASGDCNPADIVANVDNTALSAIDPQLAPGSGVFHRRQKSL
jgi:hypothetical protein